MAVRAVVHPSSYLDSVVLLRVARALRALPGVREAAALMGTPANHELLAVAGLRTAQSATAGPGDLVLAVDAEKAALAESALLAADRLLTMRRPPSGSAEGAAPRTLEAAYRRLPGATLASISVPGAYAATEGRAALRAGLHVFLFSDNVSVEDEVQLKTLAVRRGLLCMGPDCGTAYVNGIGLGFANVVPRGRVGVVAASGTGLQVVATRVARLGAGVSHGIGVGGRDLSTTVGGLMTVAALAALAHDPETAVVVLVSKPPAAAVLPRVEAALAALGKPAVVCCLGAPPRPTGPGRWVETPADAADAAVAMLRGEPWMRRRFADPAAVRARLARARAAERPHGPALLGLYTGGTLAYEAQQILEPHLGRVASNLGSDEIQSPHRLLDLGADELTVGRPHPMLDPEARAARVREAACRPEIGVLVVDLVLGRGVHPDPAGPLAAAVREARARAAAAGRGLFIVGAVIGTPGDPQGLEGQVAALEAAGVHLLPSSAEAARFAALLVRPDLGPALLPA